MDPWTQCCDQMRFHAMALNRMAHAEGHDLRQHVQHLPEMFALTMCRLVRSLPVWLVHCDVRRQVFTQRARGWGGVVHVLWLCDTV